LRRGAAFLIVGLFDFSAWKHGFVINTATYAALFTWLMLMPWLAFRWRGRELGVALGAIVTLVVFFYVVTDHRPSELTRPVARVGDARDQLETLLLPGPRGDARRYARDYLLNAYQLDPKTLSLLRGRSVLAYPWDTTLIWAYGLDWYPLPVFPYLAYAPRLDRLDAVAMESPSGPELLLRHRPCGATYMPPFVGCEPWVANGPTFLPRPKPRSPCSAISNLFAPPRGSRFSNVCPTGAASRASCPRRLWTPSKTHPFPHRPGTRSCLLESTASSREGWSGFERSSIELSSGSRSSTTHTGTGSWRAPCRMA
jgi:hypothetical protein